MSSSSSASSGAAKADEDDWDEWDDAEEMEASEDGRLLPAVLIQPLLCRIALDRPRFVNNLRRCTPRQQQTIIHALSNY